MSEITYTDGTKVVFIDNCDCGLTGGCKKCQPFVYTPEMQQEDIELAEVGMGEYYKALEREDMILPESREERFMDEDLKKFYKKKGYKFDWEGGLKELKDEYTSVGLQKEALKMRGHKKK